MPNCNARSTTCAVYSAVLCFEATLWYGELKAAPQFAGSLGLKVRLLPDLKVCLPKHPGAACLMGIARCNTCAVYLRTRLLFPGLWNLLEQTTIIFTFEHLLALVHLCAWEQYLYEDRPGKRQKEVALWHCGMSKGILHDLKE